MGQPGEKAKKSTSIRVHLQTLVRFRLLRPYVQIEGWNQSDDKILNKIIDFFVESKGIKEKGLSDERTK